MKTTFKTIASKKINKLFNNRMTPDRWKKVFVVDDVCYFISGQQMTKCTSYLVNLNDPNLKVVYTDNLMDSVDPAGMIEYFEDLIKSVGKRDNDYKTFKVDRCNLRSQFAWIKKEFKKEYHGFAARQSPYALKFGNKDDDYKTLVNPQFLLDFHQLIND